MEQSVVSTLNNMVDFAIQQYEVAEQEVPGFNEKSPEDHFDTLLILLHQFLDAAENSEFLEDMEDNLAGIVGACLAIAVSADLFPHVIDGEEEV